MMSDDELAEIREQAERLENEYAFNGKDICRLLAHIDALTAAREHDRSHNERWAEHLCSYTLGLEQELATTKVELDEESTNAANLRKQLATAQADAWAQRGGPF